MRELRRIATEVGRAMTAAVRLAAEMSNEKFGERIIKDVVKAMNSVGVARYAWEIEDDVDHYDEGCAAYLVGPIPGVTCSLNVEFNDGGGATIHMNFQRGNSKLGNGYLGFNVQSRTSEVSEGQADEIVSVLGKVEEEVMDKLPRNYVPSYVADEEN